MKRKKKLPKIDYKFPKIDIEKYHDKMGVLYDVIKTTLGVLSCNKVEFSIDMVPPSANEMYEKSIFKNKRTGRSFIAQKNSDEVKVLRIFVQNQIIRNKINWVPKGPVVAVVTIESSKWLTKAIVAAKKDIDNCLKTLFDAAERPLKTPDQMIFSIFATKVPSKVEKTTVVLYDLGEEN